MIGDRYVRRASVPKLERYLELWAVALLPWRPAKVAELCFAHASDVVAALRLLYQVMTRVASCPAVLLV